MRSIVRRRGDAALPRPEATAQMPSRRWLVIPCILAAATVVPATAGIGPSAAAGSTQAPTGAVGGWISMDMVPTPKPGPVSFYSGFNTSGATNTGAVTDRSPNAIDVVVTFPKVGGAGGVVSADGWDADACAPLRWGQKGQDEKITVRCDLRGLDYLVLEVHYTRAIKPSGSFAYAYADRPTASAYVPNPVYQFSTAGSTARMNVRRTAIGSYQVRVPRVKTAHGAVRLNAVGKVDTVCRVLSWKPLSTAKISDQSVGVLCHDAQGSPRDSAFTLTYFADQNFLGMSQLQGGWALADKPWKASYVPSRQWTSPGLSRISLAPDGENSWWIEGGTVFGGPEAVICSGRTPFLFNFAGSARQITPVGTNRQTCITYVD